jgi:hypothetical protein
MLSVQLWLVDRGLPSSEIGPSMISAGFSSPSPRHPPPWLGLCIVKRLDALVRSPDWAPSGTSLVALYLVSVLLIGQWRRR